MKHTNLIEWLTLNTTHTSWLLSSNRTHQKPQWPQDQKRHFTHDYLHFYFNISLHFYIFIYYMHKYDLDIFMVIVMYGFWLGCCALAGDFLRCTLLCFLYPACTCVTLHERCIKCLVMFPRGVLFLYFKWTAVEASLLCCCKRKCSALHHSTSEGRDHVGWVIVNVEQNWRKTLAGAFSAKRLR